MNCAYYYCVELQLIYTEETDWISYYIYPRYPSAQSCDEECNLCDGQIDRTYGCQNEQYIGYSSGLTLDELVDTWGISGMCGYVPYFIGHFNSIVECRKFLTEHSM